MQRWNMAFHQIRNCSCTDIKAFAHFPCTILQSSSLVCELHCVEIYLQERDGLRGLTCNLICDNIQSVEP